MRGIFYSVIIILFTFPLLFLSAMYVDSIKTASEGFTTKAVSDKMVSFAKSVDSDLPRATKIIARRSVEANIQYIEIYGTPLDDAEKRITEAIMNGTFYGNTTVLDNFTLTSWSKLRSISYDKGFHSPDNQIKLKKIVDVVVLPKKEIFRRLIRQESLILNSKD